MGASYAGRTFFVPQSSQRHSRSAPYPTSSTRSKEQPSAPLPSLHIPQGLSSFAFIHFSPPRMQPCAINIFYTPKRQFPDAGKPFFAPGLPQSFFERIALILATNKGTAQAIPLSRRYKIKTLPARGNGTKDAWGTAAHQKAGHRPAASRAVLCGEYSSTCRRVLEYSPQSTVRCS